MWLVKDLVEFNLMWNSYLQSIFLPFDVLVVIWFEFVVLAFLLSMQSTLNYQRKADVWVTDAPTLGMIH